MYGMITIGILLLFGVIGLIAYLVGTYNTFVRLFNNIDKSWSNTDVILKQRHDELPKLVDVCNSYMAHERETLEAVTKARAVYGKSMTVDEKARAENQLTSALGSLFAVAEQYPDLKANQEFLHIQQRISVLESTIADRREFYNDSVNLYNIRIEQIPANWVAQQSGYRARPLLEVPQAERGDVKLTFANRAPRTENKGHVIV
jgi:LemA protein